MKRDLKNPLASTFGDDESKKKGAAKKPKNYNYQAAADRYQEEYPSASGITSMRQKEIEDSFKPKRKEWVAAYNRGEMKRGALKDSIISTLGPKTKVGDFMPKRGGYKPSTKKVRYWIGGNSASPWISWESPKIFGGGEKKTK